MMKNLLGKKKENTDSNNDEEVQKLREKFNDIVNSPTENPQTNTQQQPTQTPINQTTQNPNPQNNQEQFKYVDPEKAEENERITNLIMQQIKELIEIDNNLNDKNKELENKISENSNTLSTTKEIVQQFNSRLELIEKNMEKFMGLYEVVTNRFNPFVSEEEPGQATQNNNQTPANNNVNTPNPTIQSANNENNIKKEIKPTENQTEPTLEDPINKKTVEPQKTTDLEIKEEIQEIVHNSGIDTKLDKEKQAIVKEELNLAIESVGNKAKNKDAQEEITKHVTEVISNNLKKELTEHIKVSNEELKNTMKEMLLQTVSHLKENSKPTAQEVTQNQQPNIQTSNNTSSTTQEQPKNQNNQIVNNQQAPSTTQEQTTTDSSTHEEVHPDFHFNLADGTPIKSIQGLKDALKSMDENSFNQHVNAEKNDFAEWIRIVHHNEEIANKLINEKTREGIQKILNAI